MKIAFKILILYCLVAAMLFSMISCNWNSKREEITTSTESTPGTTSTQSSLVETTPVETTTEETIAEETTVKDSAPEQTTPETTTPEATTPNEETSTEEIAESTTTTEEITSLEESTFEQETTIPEETTTPAETTHLEETTTPAETTIPEETTPPEPPHEHVFVNGQCVCGLILVIEKESVFDNDNNGKNDVFYFSPCLPEKFQANETIVWLAGDYYPQKSSNVGREFVGDAREECWYCRENTSTPSYIYYVIDVPEAGTYEMAIYVGLDDDGAIYGAKYTVNEESSFETSYQFATAEELNTARENDETISSYMFGIQIELKAGTNTIKIEGASNIENNQLFRAFYFVKVTNS